MSSVIVPYFTPEKRSQVLRMLNIRQDGFKKNMLRVRNADKEDSGNKRIIVHYDPDVLESLQSRATFTENERKEVEALAKCRGILFDLDTMTILKMSFPQTINVPTAYVPLDGYLPIMTSEGEFAPDYGKYKSYYGGTLLHTYWYKGKAYFSTFSHVDASNSHFGDSDNFADSFYKNQTTIKSIDDLYTDTTDKTEVHIFILNDVKVLVDSRDNQQESRVIYLKSLSIEAPWQTDLLTANMTAKINEDNKDSEKKILFSDILTPQEVNQRLKGNNIDVSDGYDGDRNELLYRFQNFFGGEKVIYEHFFGICTLVPPSCKYRQKIMDGKNNINKLFVDCMADSNNEKELVDVAFGLDDCLRIAEKIQMGETIYVDEYNIVTDNKQLQVLTNLLFVVPIYRIPEVINAYNSFEESILRATCFLIESYHELDEAVKHNNLMTYPGISSKKFRDYLCNHIPDLVYNECKLNDFWPEVLKKKFGTYYKQMCNPDIDQEVHVLLQINMGLVAMVGNAYGDILYTFLTFEEKVRKAKVAAEKRSIR